MTRLSPAGRRSETDYFITIPEFLQKPHLFSIYKICERITIGQVKRFCQLPESGTLREIQGNPVPRVLADHPYVLVQSSKELYSYSDCFIPIRHGLNKFSAPPGQGNRDLLKGAGNAGLSGKPVHETTEAHLPVSNIRINKESGVKIGIPYLSEAGNIVHVICHRYRASLQVDVS